MLGAALAYANGAEPLAGGSAAVAAERAAGYLAKQYDDGHTAIDPTTGKFNPNLLPEHIKEEIKAQTGAVASVVGAAGGSLNGASGGNGALFDAQVGGVLGQNAVENNNALDRLDGFTPDERALRSRWGLNRPDPDAHEIANLIKQGKLVLDKTLADYIYAKNKDPNLVIEVPDNGKPLDVVLLDKKKGWKANPAKPDEEIHGARVAYTSYSRWAVFGKVVVSRHKKTGKIRIIPDTYDFEMQDWQNNKLRNIETFIGSPGSGTKFKIDFKGRVNIVN